jgi:hypothetical protein
VSRFRQARSTCPVLFLSFAAMAGTAAAQQPKSYTLSGPSAAVYNLAGRLTIEPGSGSATTVEVTPVGADAGKLTIETGPQRNRQALRVIYPDDRIIYPALGRGSSTDVRVNDDGTFDTDWHSGHSVEIRGSGSGLEAHADLKIRMAAGSRLDVHLAAGDVTVTNANGNLQVSTGSGDVTASGVKGSFEVETGSGNVTAEGISGDLTAETGSGDVRLAQQAGDRVKIETGSGNITSTGVEATRLELETGSGDIQLDRASTQGGSLDTGSGDITATFAPGLTSLKVETGSGDVRLTLPSDYSGLLDVETGNQDDIVVDFPFQLVRKDESSVRGKIGNGTGSISIETGSGGVRLSLAAK